MTAHVSQAVQHTLRCCMPMVRSGQNLYCKERVFLPLSCLAFCMHGTGGCHTLGLPPLAMRHLLKAGSC